MVVCRNIHKGDTEKIGRGVHERTRRTGGVANCSEWLLRRAQDVSGAGWLPGEYKEKGRRWGSDGRTGVGEFLTKATWAHKAPFGDHEQTGMLKPMGPGDEEDGGSG